MKEVITTPDGMKLTAQYRAVYQDRRMKKENRFMGVWNPKHISKNASVQQMFDTYEEAKAELAKTILLMNRDARVEIINCGDIGIDLVIDEETAKEHEIIYWEIQKQWRSGWELADSSNA